MDSNSPLAHLIAILALPFWVVILVPCYLHQYGQSSCCDIFGPTPSVYLQFIGVLLFIIGLILFAWSVWLFGKRGHGTLAPWAPPVHFVVEGPYRYVRNPMISGVNLMLLGIAIYLGDMNILLWQVFFFALNTVFFVLKEEPDLEKRFGEKYANYKKGVPRWIPRLRAWQPD